MIWFEDALCQQMDPEMFFPLDSSPGNEARQVCHLCPVIAECLEYALRLSPAVEGIWAGTSARQRRVIRSERGIQLPDRPNPWREFLAS